VSPIAINQIIKNNRAGEKASVFFLKIVASKTRTDKKHIYDRIVIQILK